MKDIRLAITVGGVEADIGERWNQGIDHHPKTEEIIEAIQVIESFNGGDVGIDFGGDGDNGEAMAYCLDIFFEAKDVCDPLCCCIKCREAMWPEEEE